MAELDQVDLKAEDAVATVTMVSDTTLNTLGEKMLDALREAFQKVRNDRRVRCLIVTGTGRAFSAGANLRELSVLPAAGAYDYSGRGQAAVDDLENLGIPSIAKMNGFAFGGGLELALGATFRIATPDVIVGLPELRLGLIPGFGGTQRLGRLVGMQAALRLVLTSERIPASHAHSIGLIDEVARDRSELDNRVNSLAETLTRQPQNAMATAIRMIRSQGILQSDAMSLEARCFSEVFAHPNRVEGLSSFFQKRDPQFDGAKGVNTLKARRTDSNPRNTEKSG